MNLFKVQVFTLAPSIYFHSNQSDFHGSYTSHLVHLLKMHQYLSFIIWMIHCFSQAIFPCFPVWPSSWWPIPQRPEHLVFLEKPFASPHAGHVLPQTFRGWLLSRSPPTGSPGPPWWKLPHQSPHPVLFLNGICGYLFYVFVYLLLACIPWWKQRLFPSCFQYQAHSVSIFVVWIISDSRAVLHDLCMRFRSTVASPLVQQQPSAVQLHLL